MRSPTHTCTTSDSSSMAAAPGGRCATARHLSLSRCWPTLAHRSDSIASQEHWNWSLQPTGVARGSEPKGPPRNYRAAPTRSAQGLPCALSGDPCLPHAWKDRPSRRQLSRGHFRAGVPRTPRQTRGLLGVAGHGSRREPIHRRRRLHAATGCSRTEPIMQRDAVFQPATTYLDSSRKRQPKSDGAVGSDGNRISGLSWERRTRRAMMESRARGSQSVAAAWRASEVIGFPSRRSGPMRHQRECCHLPRLLVSFIWTPPPLRG